MEQKRFIAGAICPQCGEQDKLFTYIDSGDRWRACANCDFRESQAESLSQPAQEELPTRVNRNKVGEQPLAHEVPVEQVKIIDPGDKQSS